MNKRNIIEILFAGILIILAVLILNPFNFWMPGMVHLVILACVVAVSGALAGLFYRESANDERESSHRMLADRVGFLLGASVLVVGIVYEGLSDAVDPWLVVALVVMVVAKILTRLYSDSRL